VTGGAATYHHVERFQRLKAGDHGRYERVARDLGEDIALVPDVLDLLQTDHCDVGVSDGGRATGVSLPTVDLAQDLQRKHLVLVAAAGVFQAH
jgi:hypothetical protein